MTFREFAVNYLSPFYVMLQQGFLYVAFIGFITTVSVNGSSLGASALPQVLLCLALTYAVSRLPLKWVFALMCTALMPFIAVTFPPGFLNTPCVRIVVASI